MSVIIKNQREIRAITKSCRIVSECLQFATGVARAGMTTEELDYLLDDYIRGRGATPACFGYKGFPKSTCLSVNNVVCHGVPNSTVLKEGDIVKVDVATIMMGYYGDACCTLEIGTIGENAKRLSDTTKQALYAGIEAVKPGRRLGVIGKVIREIAESGRYSVVEEFCGHGVGLRFHEEPNVLHHCDERYGPIMEPGMIFTIEPIFNEGCGDVLINEADGWTVTTSDGSLSAQWEHSILVTLNGYEILTR